MKCSVICWSVFKSFLRCTLPLSYSETCKFCFPLKLNLHPKKLDVFFWLNHWDCMQFRHYTCCRIFMLAQEKHNLREQRSMFANLFHSKYTLLAKCAGYITRKRLVQMCHCSDSRRLDTETA